MPESLGARCLPALLASVLLAACATLSPGPGSPGRPPPSADTRAPALRVLDWYHGLREADATELAHLRRQYADKAGSAEIQLRQALLAAHPLAPNLGRARSLLDGVLATQSAEARALQPLAHTLLEQLTERQHLEATAQRAAQASERSAQQLKDAQLINTELQGKLDALAEIERSLPARPSPSAPSPVPSDRSTP